MRRWGLRALRLLVGVLFGALGGGIFRLVEGLLGKFKSRKCGTKDCSELASNTVEWFASSKAHTRNLCERHTAEMLRTERSARALALGAGELD